VQAGARFDYTVVGHVTVDVMSDGSRRPGGSAFYSGLQAARLGKRTLILTQGAPGEIEGLMEPYRSELDLEILAAQQTTTLATAGAGDERSQRVLAWAGPMGEELSVDTEILHLAPVARETPRRWRGSASFVALTPQGLLRDWPQKTGQIVLTAPDQRLIPAGIQAMVLSEHESERCEQLIADATRADAIVAVTAGAGPTTVRLPGGRSLVVEVPRVEHPREDIGAGDVFSAAFFVALAEGRTPQRAAEFATAAAAVRIAGDGVEAIGQRAAIEARLAAVA
jgi:sugar/nucleoside kinase (ribokinase family)